MSKEEKLYLDTPIKALYEDGHIERGVLRACQAAKPPLETAGDVAEYFEARGNFSQVPGCRRPGRIPDTLVRIATTVQRKTTPTHQKPIHQKRQRATVLKNEAMFDFLSENQRAEMLKFKAEHGHLPMFRVLKCYLNRPEASRNDLIMGYSLGMNEMSEDSVFSLAEIASHVSLSRERVRQIAQTYVFPEQLMHSSLWTSYADHSTYYVDENNTAFQETKTIEMPEISFGAYAAVLQRTTMLQNVDDKFMARRGWVKEITAWTNRLTKLMAMPRSIDNRISLDGLAMGGALDTRISLVVLHQIAPSLGITPDAPDAIILPKNQ